MRTINQSVVSFLYIETFHRAQKNNVEQFSCSGPKVACFRQPSLSCSHGALHRLQRRAFSTYDINLTAACKGLSAPTLSSTSERLFQGMGPASPTTYSGPIHFQSVIHNFIPVISPVILHCFNKK